MHLSDCYGSPQDHDGPTRGAAGNPSCCWRVPAPASPDRRPPGARSHSHRQADPCPAGSPAWDRRRAGAPGDPGSCGESRSFETGRRLAAQAQAEQSHRPRARQEPARPTRGLSDGTGSAAEADGWTLPGAARGAPGCRTRHEIRARSRSRYRGDTLRRARGRRCVAQARPGFLCHDGAQERSRCDRRGALAPAPAERGDQLGCGRCRIHGIGNRGRGGGSSSRGCSVPRYGARRCRQGARACAEHSEGSPEAPKDHEVRV